MRKNIMLACVLALSIVYSPLATARPKPSKGNTKKEATQKQRKQGSKTSKAIKQADKKKLKEEIKEWKKRKDNLRPLQLKDLIEENHRLRMQNQKLEVTIKELEIKLKNAPDKQAPTSGPANLALRDLAELPEGSYTIDKATGQVFIGGVLDERYGVDPETGIPFIKGIIFKVQIGARKDLDLKDVLVDEVHHENLEQEKEDSLYKYTIGHFRNYWEADKLKKGLRVLGIKLAWIVPYKDGKRVLLKDVLPTVLEQKAKREK